MLFDFTEAPTTGCTSTCTTKDIIINSNTSGRAIFLLGTRKAICEMLEKQRIARHFNTGHMYHSRLDALLHVQSLLNDDTNQD